MSLAVTAGFSNPPIDGMDNSQKLIHLYGPVVATGNYATGGDILDFTKSKGIIPSGYKPVYVEIHGSSGFVYRYVPGTTQANGKVKVYTGAAAQAALTELSAGAYPAGVLGDSIVVHAVFARI